MKNQLLEIPWESFHKDLSTLSSLVSSTQKQETFQTSWTSDPFVIFPINICRYPCSNSKISSHCIIAWPYIRPISRTLPFPTHYWMSLIARFLGKRSHWLGNVRSPLSHVPIWFPKWFSQATLSDSLRMFPAGKWISFCLSPSLSSLLLCDNIRTSTSDNGPS